MRDLNLGENVRNRENSNWVKGYTSSRWPGCDPDLDFDLDVDFDVWVSNVQYLGGIEREWTAIFTTKRFFWTNF